MVPSEADQKSVLGFKIPEIKILEIFHVQFQFSNFV